MHPEIVTSEILPPPNTTLQSALATAAPSSDLDFLVPQLVIDSATRPDCAASTILDQPKLLKTMPHQTACVRRPNAGQKRRQELTLPQQRLQLKRKDSLARPRTHQLPLHFPKAGSENSTIPKLSTQPDPTSSIFLDPTLQAAETLQITIRRIKSTVEQPTNVASTATVDSRA